MLGLVQCVHMSCACTTARLARLLPQLPQSSDTAFKNELLFTQFGINYAQLPEQFRKVSLRPQA